MVPTRVVKRYRNRKLYDAASRRHLTLDGLARLVARGEDVQVLEQGSGEDVTAPTLAQAILDALKARRFRIPGQILAHLIRVGMDSGRSLGDWPGPREAAARAGQDAERIAGRLLSRGRLTLEEALALRKEVGQSVHRIVAETQSGLESRFRGLLAPAESSTSLASLRERLGAFEASLARPRSRRRRRTRVRGSS